MGRSTDTGANEDNDEDGEEDDEGGRRRTKTATTVDWIRCVSNGKRIMSGWNGP